MRIPAFKLRQSVAVLLVQSMALATTPAAAADRTPPGPPPPLTLPAPAGAAIDLLVEELASAVRAGIADDGTLIARMQHPPGEPPPQAAIEACEGVAEGNPCAFEDAGGAFEGICRAGPRREAPACVPAGGGGGSRPPR